MKQVLEQAPMIENPMECRSAKDAINRLVEWKVLQVSAQKLHTITKLWQKKGSRHLQHIL